MIPVLEIGGTHVSAALVDPSSWTVAASRRLELDADAPANDLLDRFAAAAGSIEAPAGSTWGVAIPDPFDYVRGIGRFAGVAKFGSLNGVDVGAALRMRLEADLAFVNDADSFALGEWIAGALDGAARCAGITLGTGVGSGWLVDGIPVDPGMPPGGRIHLLQVGGAPLEDAVSRRAIRRAFAARGGDPGLDVREICEAARSADRTAQQVLDDAGAALGAVAGPCVRGFEADTVVIGGSMSASWELFEPAFLHAAGADLPAVVVAAHPDSAPLLGAAVHASRRM